MTESNDVIFFYKIKMELQHSAERLDYYYMQDIFIHSRN